jgi:hypothetical protein
MGDEALLDFLRHRMRGESSCDKLETISLTLQQSLGKAPLARETVKELRSMLEQGLYISVHDWSLSDVTNRTTNLILKD